MTETSSPVAHPDYVTLSRDLLVEAVAHVEANRGARPPEVDYPPIVVCPSCYAYAESVEEISRGEDGNRRWLLEPCDCVVEDFTVVRWDDDITWTEHDDEGDAA